ncbi:MAG: hypothetical protein MJZ33_04755 [Paludibacteraceae bacterium]|nr:hypothetical protein [Paludibacteraceae bacterium]
MEYYILVLTDLNEIGSAYEHGVLGGRIDDGKWLEVTTFKSSGKHWLPTKSNHL